MYDQKLLLHAINHGRKHLLNLLEASPINNTPQFDRFRKEILFVFGKDWLLAAADGQMPRLYEMEQDRAQRG